MKKMNLSLLVAFFLSALSLPAISKASPINPASPAGMRLVQRLASEASNAFVEQTEALASNEGEALEKFRLSCEGAKSAILADIETLEVKNSRDLLDAKAALEKVICPASDSVEFAPANGQKVAHDKFFSATVSLRSFASLN